MDEPADAQAVADRLRRVSALHRSAAAATSPPAVESTLARISDEVMHEAIERHEREVLLSKQGPSKQVK